MRIFVGLVMVGFIGFSASSCARSDLVSAIRRIPAPALVGPEPGLYFDPVSGLGFRVPEGALGVRYTLDADAPVSELGRWSEHSRTVPTLDRSAKIRAYAYGVGTNMSELISGSYRVAAAPVSATPAGGPFDGPVDVTLSCPTPGATIRYTLDGSDPTDSSPAYAAAIPLSAATVLKARAFLPPRDPSPVTTEAYGLGGPLRIVVGHNLPRSISGAGLSLAGEFSALSVAANGTLTLNHALGEAGSSYRWYLNGGPSLGSGKSLTVGPAGGTGPLTPGNYELCAELVHGAYSYSYLMAFQVLP